MSKTTSLIFIGISLINIWGVFYNLYKFGGGTAMGLEDITSVNVGALVQNLYYSFSTNFTALQHIMQVTFEKTLHI